MKARLTGAVAALALALAAAVPAHASPPPVDARAYVVANAATGDVLAQQDAAEPLPIASITKLMTALVALEHLQPEQMVTVSRAATRAGEESIHLRPGQQVTVRDLLKGALIQSANDAADALADAAAGGDRALFVSWMNEKAAQLGLHGTHFARPDGLDAPDHVSTARDVLRLAEVAMHNAAVRALVRERDDTLASGTAVHTWNDLLGVFPGLIGVKTGHTNLAGWCEVAAAQQPGYTIYVVVLGSPTRAVRNAALEALLGWGVAQYRVQPLVVAGRPYAQAATGWGRRPLALVAARRLLRPYRVDRPLVERVVAPAVVSLPVRRGQRLGRIELWEGRRLLGTRPLVASRSIARPGLAGRVAFLAGRTLHHVLGFFS